MALVVAFLHLEPSPWHGDDIAGEFGEHQLLDDSCTERRSYPVGVGNDSRTHEIEPRFRYGIIWKTVLKDLLHDEKRTIRENETNRF